MITNKTVIISCAGIGSRLGAGMPKALIEVDGKPLIIRTLELLKDVKDVRVVVGYQSEKVINIVKNFRKDVIFVYNNIYINNGTAASVSLALDGAEEYFLTIDGDLIIHPEDVDKLLNTEGEFICGTKIDSQDPVKLSVNENNEVVSFSREVGEYEWTGVCCMKTAETPKADKHMYQMIEPRLPKPFLYIRTKEVDTPEDLENATKWVKNNYEEATVIGVLGGMGSYATLEFFKQILNAFPAEKEWERPRVIIDNNCTMPSRVRAVLYNENRELLINQMGNSIMHLLSSGATDIILACNTSHVFLDEIERRNPKIKRYMHNIIEETAIYCKNENIDTVYLLASEGTVQSKIYDNVMSKYGIKVIYKSSDFEKVREFIEVVKQSKVNDTDLNNFNNFVTSIDCENILLGCTELPVLNNLVNITTKNIINPLDVVINNIKNKKN